MIRRFLWKLKQTQFNKNRTEAQNMLVTSFSYVKGNQIPGDFCEFGTLFGDLSIDAYYLNSKLNPQRQVFLFDSFEGLPKTPEPYFQNLLQPGEFSFSQQNFTKRLKRFGVKLESVHIVPGFFSDSLKDRKNPSSIAIAWVDCDLYTSIREVLDFLAGKLSQGSLLILDDYFLFENPSMGARLAVKEWLTANPNFQLTHYRDFHWAGRAFIFNYS